MQKHVFNLLTITAIYAYIVTGMYFGVYFDIQNIATFLIASLACPILAYYSIVFITKNSFNYLEVSQHFTRSITLQIIDPLLN